MNNTEKILVIISKLSILVGETPGVNGASVDSDQGLTVSERSMHCVSCPNWMVSLPGGVLQTGSWNKTSYGDEYRTGEVDLSSFCMAKTEITQRQWLEVMGYSPSAFQAWGRRCPVDSVSWFQAVLFCNKLSEREGLVPCYRFEKAQVIWDSDANGFRLPTEAEWEYACRAGTETVYHTGNDTEDLDVAGYYFDNADNRTHRVAQKVPNPWGLYDMHGNVWEWCWDWFGEYSRFPEKDPSGPMAGDLKTLRGGIWLFDARGCTSAVRYWLIPRGRSYNVGFRVVRSCFEE